MIKSKPLIASTHPAEYLLHKYWARKPHNILADYISSNFKTGDFVCDPFCGSGVFLAEAKSQGLNTLGIDINPLACLLTEVTLNPPDAKTLSKELSKIIELLEAKWGNDYTLENKRKIRYLVHAVVAKCNSCGSLETKNEAIKKGSKYICSRCEERIYFNFENLYATKIIQIVTDDKLIIDRSDLNENLFIDQEKKSLKSTIKNDLFNSRLVTNRRILAFPEMKVSDLFTKRAYSVATQLFSLAHKINDERTRRATLLFLTSNLAQFSRLIPYRNNLNTGGPAWTVPGFWIAPIHLEGNPLVHLKARYKKFINGIDSLNKKYGKYKTYSSVKNKAMQTSLEKIKNESVDGFFFDPPYGDSVPYLEFSAFWNSFLKTNPNYKNEIVVSDRKEFSTDWSKYEEGINSAVSLMSKKLKDTGKIILTFNNLEPRAWMILLESFKKNDLKCTKADYQIPAVISSKAQFAANTSYTGDFYCIFELSKEWGQDKNNPGIEAVIDSVMPIFLSRKGKAPKNIILRYGILAILQENLSIDYFDKLSDIFYGIAKEDGEYYILREEVKNKYTKPNNEYDLSKKLENICIKFLKDGKQSIKSLYEQVLMETYDIGTPTLKEMKDLLKGVVLFDNNQCYLQGKKGGGQISLFIEG